MKKLTIGILTVIAVIALAICLAACNNGGNENEQSRMNEIAGNYYLSYYSVVVDGEMTGEYTYTKENAIENLILNADGTGTVKATIDSEEYTRTLTWTVSGDMVKLKDYDPYMDEFKIEGNIMKYEMTQRESYDTPMYIPYQGLEYLQKQNKYSLNCRV